MRDATKRALNVAFAATGLALVALPTLADTEVRRWEEVFAIGQATTLVLEVPVGEVEVRGTDGDAVVILIEADCDSSRSRCADTAHGLRFEGRERADRYLVDLEGWPRNGWKAPELEIVVEAPRSASLSLDLGVGEVTVSGMEGDVEIDTGVGEVTVRMARSLVERVSLESGVGEVSLRPRPDGVNESGFIGHDLEWRRGPGDRRISVDVGVGEIDVVLE